MAHLEPSADGVALALNAFKKALDSLYWERVKTLSQHGDLFPIRNALFEVQDKIRDLVSSGGYTSLQARALSAAFQSWTPPTKEGDNG